MSRTAHRLPPVATGAKFAIGDTVPDALYLGETAVFQNFVFSASWNWDTTADVTERGFAVWNGVRLDINKRDAINEDFLNTPMLEIDTGDLLDVDNGAWTFLVSSRSNESSFIRYNGTPSGTLPTDPSLVLITGYDQ